MRGTRSRGGLPLPLPWFIPACAGNSQARLGGPCCHCGSSPRVRGTRNGAPGAYVASRFIPACAGNSNRPCADPAAKPVHPRVCGELSNGAIPLTYPAGSSPRVRGTRTPAAWQTTSMYGSSPRVRGTRPALAAHRRIRRFIPACAGNSFPRTLLDPLSTVHPRVCGELHQGRGVVGFEERFIPACAGNSVTPQRPTRA